MGESIYVPEGSLLRPTPHAAGPWSSDGQHGGPVNALVARAVEVHAAGFGEVLCFDREGPFGRSLQARLAR